MRGLECPCSNPGCVTGRGGGARYWALEGGGWAGSTTPASVTPVGAPFFVFFQQPTPLHTAF